MKALFADTSLFVAYLNPKDKHHGLALEYMNEYAGRIVTTSWILVELGNYLSKGRQRRLVVPFVNSLKKEDLVTVLPADEDQLDRAFTSYGRRADKEWSLTDCL
jgi:predicted nucleic acid-binding protein